MLQRLKLLFDRTAAHSLNDAARQFQQSRIGYTDHHSFIILTRPVNLFNLNLIFLRRSFHIGINPGLPRFNILSKPHFIILSLLFVRFKNGTEYTKGCIFIYLSDAFFCHHIDIAF